AGRTPVNNKILAIGIALLVAACASTPEPAPPPAPAPAPAPKQEPPAPPPAAKPAPAAAAPAPAKRCDASVTFQNDETYPFARAELTGAAKSRLDRDVIGRLATCSTIEAVVIEGHADRLGS